MEKVILVRIQSMFASLTLLHKNPAYPQAVADLLESTGVKSQPKQLAQASECNVWQWQMTEAVSEVTKAQLASLLTAEKQQGLADYVLYEGEQAPEIKLAVFDMDSTLIQAEVMDQIAFTAGIG